MPCKGNGQTLLSFPVEGRAYRFHHFIMQSQISGGVWLSQRHKDLLERDTNIPCIYGKPGAACTCLERPNVTLEGVLGCLRPLGKETIKLRPFEENPLLKDSPLSFEHDFVGKSTLESRDSCNQFLVYIGGSIITEMRRLTKASIRIVPKENLLKIAAEDDEMVQMSGDLDVAKGALVHVLTWLRANLLIREGNVFCTTALVPCNFMQIR
ncbi:hypothetical protein VNO77_14428 [Canavalia gladiata]|uniref:Uncharacterized protein n=1 Tax=Canavalia gladiata TaxID=3824 RepID=A0AAN9QNQ2_CANGL